MKNLIIISILVLGMSACSASCGAKDAGIALNVEKSVRTTVVTASTMVEPLVCAPAARKVMGNDPCLKFLDVLEPTVNVAIEYNLALQQGRAPNVAATVASITKLIDAIKILVPQSTQRDQAILELSMASSQASKGGL